MMEKVITAGSWDGPGMDQPARIVKVSSRGLIGNDRTDFLKIASHVFADVIDNIKLAANEIPIHLNAVGATEGYGCNRNGDGFKEATCLAQHPTFVKDARYYAHHKNKDPAKSYGYVKKSAYNDAMRRIELLVLGNMDKEAADRNGGLPMKAATLAKLQRGEMVPFSMACKVAYDVCSNCFNKAANRSEYCTSETCISPSGRQGFGCKDGLTKVADDGWQQYVENPGAMFFDISEVIKNADRIARGTTADYMMKAAAQDYVPGGAELAEFWAKQGADFSLMSPEESIFHHRVLDQVKLARELAELERRFEASRNEKDAAFARGLAPSTGLDVSRLGALGSSQLASGLAALAGEKVALTLPDFLRLITGEQGEKIASLSADVARHLPGVFSRVADNPSLNTVLRANAFSPSRDLPSASMREWAAKQASEHSLATAAVRDRVSRSAIHSASPPSFIEKAAMVKTAGLDNTSEQLAQHYALYKIAFLAASPKDVEYGQLKSMAVRQNYIEH